MTLSRLFTGAVAPLILIAFVEGCSSGGDPQPTDCSKSGLAISVSTFQEPTGCTGDGSITVVGSGGTEPYSFSIDGGTFQSSGLFGSLAPGEYLLTVKDKNGCEATTTKLFNVPSAPTATLNQTQNTSCLSPYNGSIEVVGASGGTGPYMYKLDGGTYGSSTTFSNVKDGSHTVTIKDNGGCEVPLLVTVTRGNTGITYDGDIKAIFQAKCLLSGCHLSNQNGQGDWGIYSEAFAKRDLIKTKTQDGSMPLTGSLSADQKALIACWVDDGAPEN